MTRLKSDNILHATAATVIMLVAFMVALVLFSSEGERHSEYAKTLTVKTR